ncbi:MAG: heme o synthase [Phycisphaeraceae bacterium]|nr:heme o synthase [Phycisphaeraceae bacterium]
MRKHDATIAQTSTLATPAIVGADSAALAHRLAAAYELTKPRITRMVAITAGVGFTMAAIGRPWSAAGLFVSAFGCILGTSLSASGANALNQWLERDRDALMHRTRTRPLPEHRLSANAALGIGLALAFAGVFVLWALCGPAAALVSAATIILYVLLYTPLKPVTAFNTLIGAVPGALPPVVGWAAAWSFGAPTAYTAIVDPLIQPAAWALFLIMLVWQVPHVLAIAWMHREDYARGGYRMLPMSDPSGRTTAATMAAWAITLIPVSLAPVLLMPESLGWLYASLALLLSGGFAAMCLRLLRSTERRHIRAAFFASIIHLPLVLMAMVADALWHAWAA